VSTHPSVPGWKWWLIPGVLLVMVALLGAYSLTRGATSHADTGHHRENGHREESDSGSPGGTRVEVTHPGRGGLNRSTTQACTAEGFEHINIFAEVSGYLGEQLVDIGSHVVKGDVLVKIEVPNLDAELEKQVASLDHARARVIQMKAHVDTAVSEVEAARALVTQSEADIKSKESYLVYRRKQYERISDLVRRGAIEERLEDEERDRRDAAEGARDAARAAVSTSKAKLEAARARLLETRADLKAAEEEVKVYTAQVKLAQAEVNFATIRAKFDGVITDRTMFPGAFVRAASRGGDTPLLKLARTDKMRIVLPIPDVDVPYTRPGLDAEVRFDALPNKVFHGKVARVSEAEEQRTRTMRCEIDLDNKGEDGKPGEIQNGMYGYATILLHRASEDALNIPASCLVTGITNHKSNVYVVRDGKAHLTEVETGMDAGDRVEIIKGLEPDDEVILKPVTPLSDGMPVSIGSKRQDR
jgi:RND family efflux transporter MFP subunit